MGWGDELMVTGRARVAQLTDPRKVRPLYDGKVRWHEAWENNPRIARPKEPGDVQVLTARTGYLRPYIVAKVDDRWTWRAHQPPRGELYFSQAEKDFGAAHAGRIVLEPALKQGASPNKDWGWERWAGLARLMKERGLQPTQLGPAGTRRLAGAELIETPTMRHAAAVLSKAQAAVLPEGGLHHVAAAVNCPAVVIFGGFISPQVTGYPEQASLFHKTAQHLLGCGWRRHCKHCIEAMAQFSPPLVLRRLEETIEKHRRSLAA